MMRKTLQSLLAVAALAALLAPFGASAAEARWRVVGYYTSIDQKPAGDVEGHVTATFKRHGLCFLPKEVGVYESSGDFEATKGKGSGTQTFTCTFDDGSSFTVKGKYNLEPLPNNLIRLTGGHGEFVAGTGRFEGVKGTASFTGRTYAPVDDVTKGDLLLNGVSQYTVSASQKP